MDNFPRPSGFEEDFVDYLSEELRHNLHLKIAIKPTGYGMRGYRDVYPIYHASDEHCEKRLGWLFLGGNTNKAGQETFCVDISGEGCSHIPRYGWKWLQDELLPLLEAKLTRVDAAKDYLEGEYALQDFEQHYHNGGFTNGGRPPRVETFGNWLTPETDTKGRTLQIGNRDNGKALRIYEKGKQLGDPTSPWLRVELELRNKDREIPYDILANPGKYLAGSYPALGFIAKGAERIKTIAKQGKIKLETALKHLRNGYGKHLHYLRKKLKWTPEKIIEHLARPGIPQRLDYVVQTTE